MVIPLNTLCAWPQPANAQIQRTLKQPCGEPSAHERQVHCVLVKLHSVATPAATTKQTAERVNGLDLRLVTVGAKVAALLCPSVACGARGEAWATTRV